MFIPGLSGATILAAHSPEPAMTTRYDQMVFDPRFEAGFQIKQAQEFDAHLLALRRDLALVQFELNQRKARHAREWRALKYNPDQPRVPARNPQGGEWTRGGGSGGAPSDSSTPMADDPALSGDSDLIDFGVLPDWNSGWIEAPEPAAPADPQTSTGAAPDGTPVEPTAERPNNNPRVNLLEHENIEDGHTIREHVAKSEEYLLERVRQEQFWYIKEYDSSRYYPPDGIRASSFPSLEAANKLVNAAIAADPEKLARVVSGDLGIAVFKVRFGSWTGIEAYAAGMYSSAYIRDTNGVIVVVKPTKELLYGFRIHTAYPTRR
jgi:Bacterial CdiA-CT RNAse A domain